MNTCPKCFAPVPSDSQWCLQCGTKIVADNQQQNENQQSNTLVDIQNDIAIETAWQVADSAETATTILQE